MAKTVAEGFEALLSRIPPTETITEKARRHRESIEACLRGHFAVKQIMTVGSFGHGTNIPRFSDIDLFVVMPEEELSSDSARALRAVKTVLAKRFWATSVRVSSPSVLVTFGSSRSEWFEITPAFPDNEEKGVYYIPDRGTEWLLSAPRAHNAYVNKINDRLSKRPKRLIRLLKLWNALSGARIRSIYLELRVAKGLQDVDQINYAAQFRAALRRIHKTELTSMQDPIGYTGLIAPCSDARKAAVMSKLWTALRRAEKALQAEEAGHIRKAFHWWNLVFDDRFPRYG